MVVAADDVRDAHVVVVDDDGEQVGGRAVRAQKDEIVEIAIALCDRSLNVIRDCEVAVIRHAQTDDGRLAFGQRLGRVAPWRAERAQEFIEVRAVFR